MASALLVAQHQRQLSNPTSGITDRVKQQLSYLSSFLLFAFYSDLPSFISKWSVPHFQTPRWDLISVAHEANCRKNPGDSQAHLLEAFLCVGCCFYFNSLCFWAPLHLSPLPSPSLCSWGQSFHPGFGPAHVWAKAVLRKSHLLLPFITWTLTVPSPGAKDWVRTLAAVQGDWVASAWAEHGSLATRQPPPLLAPLLLIALS